MKSLAQETGIVRVAEQRGVRTRTRNGYLSVRSQ
jgi:hypothetical protein